MKTCRECKKDVYGNSHYCTSLNRSVDSSEDIILSAVISAATDSAILGTLLGGSIVGGLLGDMFDGDLMD